MNADQQGRTRTARGAERKTMPSHARLHHLIPNFYLKGFATDDGKLSWLSTDTGRTVTQVTRRAATENDFYTTTLGGPPDEYESMIATLESEAASVFHDITDGVWPVSREQRMDLALFIAMLSLRGRETRSQMSRIAPGIIEGVSRLAVRSDPDLEYVEGLPLDVEKTDVAAKVLHFATMAVGSETIARCLTNRVWVLVRLGARGGLATSDSAPGSCDAGPWWAGSTVTFPLTRSLGLMMLRAPIPDEYLIDGAYDMVEESGECTSLINEVTLMGARNVYFHPDDSLTSRAAHKQA